MACATGETPEEPLSDGSTSGSGGETRGTAGSSGSFGNGGSTGGNSAGSFSTAGTQPRGGTFSQGGTSGTSGTTFGGGTGGAAGGAGGATAGMGGTAGAGGGAGAAGKDGNGGTGGAAPTACPAKNTWVATAFVHADTCDTPDSTSDYCAPPARAIDGDATKRFSTGEARKGTEWLQIDFTKTVTVSQVTLITPNSDFTLAYEVRLSNDAGTIAASPVVVSGAGMQGTTTIALPANETGRYLRINQTMAMAGWWSVYELNVTCQ
jgi:hypothetical protein